jgi:SNF2 family DNA or RNA helicase
MESTYGAEARSYRASFMELRKHAIFPGTEGESPKMKRVYELIDSYTTLGRNVVVFSFFLDVVRHVANRCSTPHLIHGGVPPAERSGVVDRFSSPNSGGKGKVLVSQINSGGLGLNMQAGSVAIIVEPQLNPAIEYQAVCRLHRMGQRHSVNVHRVLAQDTIEEGLHLMLARKRRYMELYARDSLLKEGAPGAVAKEDVHEVLRGQRQALMRKLSPSGRSGRPGTDGRVA